MGGCMDGETETCESGRANAGDEISAVEGGDGAMG